MSYNSATDFIALLRQISGGGVRTERMPGLDFVVAALSRMGFFQLSIGQVAPTTSQSTTAWFKPALQSWLLEGTLFLWNEATLQYEVATPDLWASMFVVSTSGTVQEVTVVGPTNVQVNADVVRVQNVGAAVALVMPLSQNMSGPVLISDWANHAGTNNITITLSGGQTFPNGAVTWTIAADSGSVFLRPVPGGYAL